MHGVWICTYIRKMRPYWGKVSSCSFFDEIGLLNGSLSTNKILHGDKIGDLVQDPPQKFPIYIFKFYSDFLLPSSPLKWCWDNDEGGCGEIMKKTIFIFSPFAPCIFSRGYPRKKALTEAISLCIRIGGGSQPSWRGGWVSKKIPHMHT